MYLFRTQRCRSVKFAVLMISLTLFLIVPMRIPIISADAANAQNVEMFPLDSKPYGKNYSEWETKLVQWWQYIPEDASPYVDQTGQNCAIGQHGPVWFLIDTGGGSAVRQCTIPAGKAILVKLFGSECDHSASPALNTESQLRECAMNEDNGGVVEADLDGTNLQVSDKNRTQTGIVNFTLPDNNIWGAPPGPDQSVADAWFIFLKPLSPGKHYLHYGGIVPANPNVSGYGWSSEVAEYLTIMTPAFSTFSESADIDGKSIIIPINSSSMVSNFTFNQQDNQILLKVSANNVTEGTTIIPVSRILHDPYSVTIDGNATSDFETINNQTSGESSITLTYDQNAHDITITGASAVPEFPTGPVVLLISISFFILISSRSRLNSSEKYS